MKAPGTVQDFRNAKAKARDAWLLSEYAQRASDPTTLGASDAKHRYYLSNRLEKAFCDGWDAAEKQFAKKKGRP